MSWIYRPQTYPLRDPGNERAYVNLPLATAWQGRGRLWGDLVQSLRAKLRMAVQGTIYVVQGPTVAAVDAFDPTLGGAVPDGVDLDQWNCYAGVGVATPYRMPVARRVGQAAVRLAYLQGAGAGNVGLEETVLDPRPVDHDTPLSPAATHSLNEGSDTEIFPILPGARSYSVTGYNLSNPLTPLDNTVYWVPVPTAPTFYSLHFAVQEIGGRRSTERGMPVLRTGIQVVNDSVTEKAQITVEQFA